MLVQTCTNCPIADIGKNLELQTLLTLFDFVWVIKPTPHRGRGPILQTLVYITKIVAFSLHWRKNRIFPVSRENRTSLPTYTQASAL
jgi:hypothetical protein